MGQKERNVGVDSCEEDTTLLDDSLVSETILEIENLGEAIELSGKPVVDAFLRLYRAHQFAIDCDRTPWEFAIEIDQLQKTGITSEEIRWLIGRRIVSHAEESTLPGQTGRTFKSPGGFRLTGATCLILSEFGVQTALQSLERFSRIQAEQISKVVERPFWDAVRHELRWGDEVVKKFKWRAANQEAILAAFQEDGWVPHIDDPLPQQPEIDPKRRLSDAIKCLNRKQKTPLVRFSGDGTGQGVLWERIKD